MKKLSRIVIIILSALLITSCQNIPGPDATTTTSTTTTSTTTTSTTTTSTTIAPSGVYTFAGSGTSGYANGTGSAASFSYPADIVVDSTGDLYVVDNGNSRIRKISSTGIVTTIAGSGSFNSVDGTGLAASFGYPLGIAIDTSKNLYVVDSHTNKIRKITPTGIVTTIAGSGSAGFTDGTGASASFHNPLGIAVDSIGNIFVADSSNNCIRKITPEKVVTTFAGSGVAGSTDGTGTAATFYSPFGIAIDVNNTLYVTDTGNQKIRKISSLGIVTTLAGSGTQGSIDGPSATASFYNPLGIKIDIFGNVYIVDMYNNKIRKITPDGIVSTIAGTGTQGSDDGPRNTASFYWPGGIAINSSGDIFVADTYNHKIRKIVQ